MLNSSSLARSVEFGQDATGDPNAVKVRGGSGFLYSERIIITVGHVIGDEITQGIAYWERDGVIYRPGIVTIAGEKQYKVKKVLVPSTYVYPDYANNSYQINTKNGAKPAGKILEIGGGLLVFSTKKCPAFLKVDLSLGDRRKK
jgi:hypothetical protein